MQQIAERIKYVRENLELTQKQLAEAAGISLASLKNYESGRRNAPVQTLASIAKALDVSLDYLAGLVDKPYPIRKETSVIDSTFYELKPMDQARIEERIQTMRESYREHGFLKNRK